MIYILSLLAVLISACSDVESDLLDSNEMNFSMSLQNKTNTSWECYTRVTDKKNSNVVLVDGDKLTCNGIRMRQQSSVVGNYRYYTAIVPIKEDNRYTITFFSKDKEYANSTITPPSEVFIQSPQNNFILGPNDVLTVFYKPSQISGEINKTVLSFSDTNESGATSNFYSITKNNLSTEDRVAIGPFSESYSTLPSKTLTLTLTLSRTSQGTVDSKIRGSFNAISQAYVYGTFVGTK